MTIAFLCPACSQVLDPSGTTGMVCPACRYEVPHTLGIPDLRAPNAHTSDWDRAIVESMVARFPQATYHELLEIRLKGAPTYGDLLGHEVPYFLTKAERGRRMIEMFQHRLVQYLGPIGNDAALDIGCGSGAGLLALTPAYKRVVGVDPSLPDLLLARKVLDTAGVLNVCLVQAHGQRLPFPDGSFDYTNALNVLEHVFELSGILSEVRRVLKPGGGFGADSRNRFDLFLPEPHVKIRWVGLMPRHWAKYYVRWRRGVQYEGTYLFSLGELRRALHRHFGQQHRVVFPSVHAYGSPSWVNRWLQLVERVPILSNLALWIFPSHLVLAWR